MKLEMGVQWFIQQEHKKLLFIAKKKKKKLILFRCDILENGEWYTALYKSPR